MGPGIVIPVVVIAVVVPIVFMWARRTFKEAGGETADEVTPPSGLLTSNALRRLPSPPWRVVHEIAAERLGGVEHVLIGPGGIFAVDTSMDPMPQPLDVAPDVHEVANAAIKRGALDDALRR